MDRRKSLKVLALGTVSGGVLLEACKEGDVKNAAPDASKTPATLNYDRMAEEKQAYQRLVGETFFTPHEMSTIAVLCDIIIPADEVSGSATQAGVPDFIEFMAKDKPDFQTPLRGGLRWLDLQMIKQHGAPFKDCRSEQQIAMVDAIAYPAKAAANMKQGVAFFSLLRNLTASGFYSSEMGIKDIGYVGNTPTRWNGVPDEVLKQYGLTYSEKELKECVTFS